MSIYPTPQGNPMLHLSFVGTPAFIDGAVVAIPARGCRRVIERCKNLVEARYNGRHAWAAATWLYADETLFSSAKHQAFLRYRDLLHTDPPRWHTWEAQRRQVLALLDAGKSPGHIAADTGLSISRVYDLRSRARRSAAE